MISVMASGEAGFSEVVVGGGCVGKAERLLFVRNWKVSREQDPSSMSVPIDAGSPIFTFECCKPMISTVYAFLSSLNIPARLLLPS